MWHDDRGSEFREKSPQHDGRGTKKQMKCVALHFGNFWYVSQPPQSANKVSYSQVGFSYDGVKDEADFSDAAEEEEEDDVFNSDDSNDEGMVLELLEKLSRKERRKAFSNREGERNRSCMDNWNRSTPLMIPTNTKFVRYLIQTFRIGFDTIPKVSMLSFAESRNLGVVQPTMIIHDLGGQDSPSHPRRHASSDHILEALHVDPASVVSLINKRVVKCQKQSEELDSWSPPRSAKDWKNLQKQADQVVKGTAATVGAR
ncbi:hypothetical protein V6N13_111502 [Hibiscus sabdariffa]